MREEWEKEEYSVPKLTKIYTRTGDMGKTRLTDHARVWKDSPRVEAYGSVDELNAQIGVVLGLGVGERLTPILRRTQNQLFHLGAELSTPSHEEQEILGPTIKEQDIRELEAQIDELQDELGPLENFILPGGTSSAAGLQLARAICRRAERRIVAIKRREQVPDLALKYINRLSDALFMFARYENARQGVEEALWDSRA